jgi:YD repeat-containing protein
LDKVDNILSIVENYNGQSQTISTDIPEDTSFSKLNQYAYFDQWGLSYDLNGNTTQKGTQHFSYDYRNQLVIATDINTTVEMKYDVFGRRIQETVAKGTQSKTRNLYYSGNQLIEERDGNDNITRQYIYGSGIDEIIRMDVYDGGTVISYYFHTDAIGSVTAITDENGNIVERYTYDIYGMPTFWDAAGNIITESSI